MRKEKVLKFVNRYKVALAIAFGFSVIGYLNPAEYKAEYEVKAETIKKLNGELVNMKETNNLDEVVKETEVIENKNNELKTLLEEKKLDIEKVKEEERKAEELKEAKKKEEEEAKKKAEEEKKRIEEERKKAEEKKNNSGTSSGNTGNSTSGTPQKPAPQKPATTPQKPATTPQNQGNMVYANGGSSTSNKYHKTPTAHNMEGAIKMSESNAKAKGYVACKKCY